MHHFELLTSDWDLIVVGAGPAGALSSLLASRGGLRVLLVEKKRFPRDKVCGGCVNGPALAILESCGLIDRLARLGGTWINRFQLLTAGRRLDVPLAGGVALSRSVFDQMLVDAAVEAGVVFLEQTTATVLESTTPEASFRRVELRRGAVDRMMNARVVVAADGLGHHSLDRLPRFGSRIHPRSYLGLAARVGTPSRDGDPASGTIAMAVARGGYVGMVRDETAAVHLAAAVSPHRLRQADSPAACVEQLVRDAGVTPGIDFAPLAWQGTGPISQSSNRVADRRLFLLGDAVRYVEPFTGEGIAWALDGASRLAPLLLRGCDNWCDSLITRWTAEIATQVRWPCRLLTGALRFPRFFGLAAWLVSHSRGLADLVAGRLDPDPRRTRRLADYFTDSSDPRASSLAPDSRASKDAA